MSPRSNADRPARPPGGLAVLTPGLLAAFAAIVVVLVAARVISTLNLRNVYAASEWVAHTHAVKDSLRQILSAALDAETGERGFIITGSASYLEPYDRARSTLAATIAQARAATADNREQQPDFDRLTTAANAKLAELAEAIRRRETSGFAAAQAVVETNVGKRTMGEMRAVV